MMRDDDGLVRRLHICHCDSFVMAVDGSCPNSFVGFVQVPIAGRPQGASSMALIALEVRFAELLAGRSPEAYRARTTSIKTTATESLDSRGRERVCFLSSALKMSLGRRRTVCSREFSECKATHARRGTSTRKRGGRCRRRDLWWWGGSV